MSICSGRSTTCSGPPANIHHPLHKWLTVKAPIDKEVLRGNPPPQTLRPKGMQTKHGFVHLFDPLEEVVLQKLFKDRAILTISSRLCSNSKNLSARILLDLKCHLFQFPELGLCRKKGGRW